MSAIDQLTLDAATALTEGLSNGKQQWLDESRLESMSRWLAAYSETTRRKIIASKDFPERLWGVEKSMSEEGETFISDYLHLAGCLEAHGFEDVEASFELLRVLPYYKGLCKQGPNHEYPEMRQRQGEAIITITCHMNRMIDEDELDHEAIDYVSANLYDGLVPKINDQRLCDFIVGGDHDPELIARIIVERSILNVDDIVALLEGAPRIFVDGVL